MLVYILLTGCSADPGIDQKFTFVIIPDTQNIVDYTHQLDKGFPVDGAAMFIEQMEYITNNVEARGGEIAFVTSVGDVWQHTDNVIDPAHYARGLRPLNAAPVDISHHLVGIKDFELPLSRRGYDMVALKRLILYLARIVIILRIKAGISAALTVGPIARRYLKRVVINFFI